MRCFRARFSFPFLICVTALGVALLCPKAGASPQDSSASGKSSSSPKSTGSSEPALGAGSTSNGAYRNSFFGFACKIPAGWVLRTEEMNSPNDQSGEDKGAQNSTTPDRVLLAAFSRPPQARGDDVNSSILIAAESAAAYPGLTEPAQYFGPVTEIARAQGFDVDEEPYEFSVGAKTLVRGDYEKNVGSRVMHQSTLVMLSRGYAVSFTFIGGTEDEVEELVSRLSFSATGKTTK
jgi:hypothetical protein